jgi:sigma-B regulation protein RsbU (phosphoserine phosphatase)
MGIINIGSKLSQKVYSQEDLNLLMTVASQTAIAVENSRLYEKEKTFTLMQEEMRLASKIQLDWLPKDPPDVPGFDIAGKMIPSELVGGDYYDFIRIDNQRLAISIGDVSGKGLSAAMLMANLHAVVRSQTFTNPIPAECMKQTNRLVFESSNEEMFITLFYGILNTEDSSFEFTNGGHNLPILVNGGGKEQLLDTEGLVIGINDNVKYGTGKISFKKDDVLVLYTDGISETFKDDNEMYGEQRLTELIKLVSHLGSREIIDRILEDITRFSSKKIAHDDMTLVVIKAV